MGNSYLVRQIKRPKNKTDQKNYRIVGSMWLGILLDLPLLYLTCPVGPRLLGKTDNGYMPISNVSGPKKGVRPNPPPLLAIHMTIGVKSS